MIAINRLARRIAVVFGLAMAAAGASHAGGTVGTSLPADFPVILDASLGTPVLGFGAAGSVARTPVIFLHGNNDTPYANNTVCSSFGRMQAMAQYFADNGYDPSELWALGYQGTQCDLIGDQTIRSSFAHTNEANVPDLRRFVKAVLDYTGAKEVDIVAHSLGVTLTREWVRQDKAQRLVRRFVAIDGPNHGIINCSPSPDNYWQLAFLGGFTPASAVCQELGSPDTPFLRRLNHSAENMGSTRVLVVRNVDASFVYLPVQDGLIAPVPAIDSFGDPTDFSQSAHIARAEELNLAGQGVYDFVLGTAHLGIANSPVTWQAAFDFLTVKSPRR
jgi:pimeloyl-ACP methyl ester carboxylesterase